MTSNYIIGQLKKEFNGKDFFSREELFSFYKSFDPDLKETTFRWRLHDLNQKKVISPISKKLFSLNYKPIYQPEIGTIEKKLSLKISKQFPSLKQCIWSTLILNEFMLHQPGRFITVLEVEKEAIEPVFHFLKDINTHNVYLNPKQKELEYYVSEEGAAIVVEPLVTKAPIQEVGGTSSTTIEKLIVDIFADSVLFSAFQGSELANIINSAYFKYNIDFTKLFNYSKRRAKGKKMKEYLSLYTNVPQTIIYD